MKRCLKILCYASILLLIGCSSDIEVEKFENESADNIYKTATSYMNNGNYSTAVKVFEELERLHPYSKYTALSQVKLGDCYYKMKKYEEAATEYEIFVKTHTTHELVTYAIYMLGLVYYEQMPIIERDQEPTIKSLGYLKLLVTNFPNCKYVNDSNKMIKELRQQLAGREVYISKYYQSHGNYAAAVSRLNVVVDLYKDTDHLPEALHRLIECYVTMGFFDEAYKVNNILQNKFPKTVWAQYAKNIISTVKK